MKLIKNLIPVLVIALIFISCNSNPCGNTGTPIGKYVSNDHDGKELYLLINKDSTFLHYYKDKEDKVQSYKGKWKATIDDCRIDLSPWKDLGMKKSFCPCISLSAQYANDRIQPPLWDNLQIKI